MTVPGRPAGPPGRTATRGKKPPGLRGDWLWGCARRIQHDPLGSYYKAWQEHGDCIRLHLLPGMHCYLVTHPEAVEHVLQRRHQNYRKPDVFNRPVGRLTGNGLLTSEGEFWLQQRRLAQPAFHRQHLAQLGPKMIAAAEACLRDLDQVGSGQVVDIVPAMMRLGLRIAGTTLFSTDISPDADAIGRAYRTAFAQVSYQMNSPPLVPWWLPTSGNRRFTRAKRLLDRVVLEMIAARRRDPDPPRDLLSLLLAAQDEETGAGMTDQQLKDEALTLLTAGHETVGAALSWTWYLLGQHPALQEALHEEAHGLLKGRSPTPDDLPQLPLTRAVFDETMRLYPPAWSLPRQALTDDKILGYAIPKGAIVIVGTYVTHRRPDLWPEPERFRPERFMAAPAASRHKFAYFPFGGGPRSCIGQTFAVMEGPLVLATL